MRQERGSGSCRVACLVPRYVKEMDESAAAFLGPWGETWWTAEKKSQKDESME